MQRQMPHADKGATAAVKGATAAMMKGMKENCIDAQGKRTLKTDRVQVANGQNK